MTVVSFQFCSPETLRELLERKDCSSSLPTVNPLNSWLPGNFFDRVLLSVKSRMLGMRGWLSR